jgi:hypothetical protein
MELKRTNVTNNLFQNYRNCVLSFTLLTINSDWYTVLSRKPYLKTRSLSHEMQILYTAKYISPSGCQDSFVHYCPSLEADIL